MPLGDTYISRAYDILSNLACEHGQPIFYSHLTNEIGLAARSVGGVLQPISERSYRERGVLLSVLAVSKRYGLPSDVFFDQARRLRAMPTTMPPQVFFHDELGRVYGSYASGGK
jgi:hypothetical protein